MATCPSCQSGARRLGQPADVAAAVVFLASEAGRWVTGHNLRVTGGLWARRRYSSSAEAQRSSSARRVARSRAPRSRSMRASTASTAPWHEVTSRAPCGVRLAVSTFPWVGCDFNRIHGEDYTSKADVHQDFTVRKRGGDHNEAPGPWGAAVAGAARPRYGVKVAVSASA